MTYTMIYGKEDIMDVFRAKLVEGKEQYSENLEEKMSLEDAYLNKNRAEQNTKKALANYREHRETVWKFSSNVEPVIYLLLAATSMIGLFLSAQLGVAFCYFVFIVQLIIIVITIVAVALLALTENSLKDVFKSAALEEGYASARYNRLERDDFLARNEGASLSDFLNMKYGAKEQNHLEDTVSGENAAPDDENLDDLYEP